MDVVKFWYIKDKADFEEKLQKRISRGRIAPSEITNNCVVFIEDTGEIWTHGKYYVSESDWMEFD